LEYDSLTFHVSAPIVDVIIADLFFRADEMLVDFDDDDDEDDGGRMPRSPRRLPPRPSRRL
jgi:hypothetical protein